MGKEGKEKIFSFMFYFVEKTKKRDFTRIVFCRYWHAEANKRKGIKLQTNHISDALLVLDCCSYFGHFIFPAFID